VIRVGGAARITSSVPIPIVGWALPTNFPANNSSVSDTGLAQAIWIDTIEHKDEMLNTADHRGDPHKTMVGGAHPTWLVVCRKVDGMKRGTVVVVTQKQKPGHKAPAF